MERMMRALLLVVVSLTMTGCATQANYERIVDSWMGANEIDLVRSWGPPANSYVSGDTKFIQYSEQRQVTIPGTEPTYTTDCYDTGYTTQCYTNQSGGTAPSTYYGSCVTTFEIQNDKVVHWSFKGNDCVAYPPE